MQMHQIEVDDEVFTYLKGKAEPFVDTPNDVLRRELLGKSPSRRHTLPISSGSSKLSLPFLPGGTPKALEQILQVIYLVRNLNIGRSRATHFVADEHRVAPQTVLDKYCRQLSLKASEFDRLLDEPDLKGLKVLLNNKFREQSAVINEYLSS